MPSMAVSRGHHGRSSVSPSRREWRSTLAHELIGPPRQDMEVSFREKWLATDFDEVVEALAEGITICRCR